MTSSQKPPQSLVLALETSGDVCGIAVLRDGQFLAEHTFRHGMHLSERLMGHIDAVLADADAEFEGITAFAVGIGPGSFTGTRIGVMTLKTLATVTEKPLYGIVGLEAVAAEYAGLRETVVVPMLPCRTGVVYTAAYSVESAAPEALLEPSALPIADLADEIGQFASKTVILCGPATGRYGDEMLAALAVKGIRPSFGQAVFPRAALIAKLADLRLAGGVPPDDALTLVPHYVSPPPITISKTNIPTVVSAEASRF